MKIFLNDIDINFTHSALEQAIEDFVPLFIDYINKWYQIAINEGADMVICSQRLLHKETPEKTITKENFKFDIYEIGYKCLAINPVMENLWPCLFSQYTGKTLAGAYFDVKELFDIELTMKHSNGEFMIRLNKAIRRTVNNEKVFFFCIDSEYVLILNFDEYKASNPEVDYSPWEVF